MLASGVAGGTVGAAAPPPSPSREPWDALHIAIAQFYGSIYSRQMEHLS